MLISEEYRALNTELHARRPDYGTRGHLWADRVRQIAGGRPCTILDYGCGKGSLKRALPGFDVREYDPAVQGKDGSPAPADIVVCVDVLEHIEPECLDAVLADLQKLTKRMLLFSICIVLAEKTLADGRNTHVCLQTVEWWADTLDQWFWVDEQVWSGTHFSGLAQPKIRQIDTFNVISALTDAERNDHMRRNREFGLGLLKENPPHDRTAIIAGFGPSLAATWRDIAIASGDVFTVSGAHKFLIDRGIVPKVHVDCDPRLHKSKQLGEPHPAVSYWLASCVHPTFVERLADYDVSLWHLWNSAATEDALDPGEWAAVGGSCVGVRAISLLYCLGYRRFDLHGFDCSFRGGRTHAGEHFGKTVPRIEIRAGDRWFTTSGAMASYAKEFFELKAHLPGALFALHGDGLLQHMCRLSAARATTEAA